MTQKIYYFAFLLFLSISYSAQNNLESNVGIKSEKFIVPTTPDSYSLFKATDFPVDYRTGKLNVQIPIYNIKVDGIDIPIKLSYNTGGIKVDEISSVTGLGWTLGIPNTITVEQHGKEDLGTNDGGSWFPKQPSAYQYSTFMSLTEPAKSMFYNLWEQNSQFNTQPDIYHYNLPTISGSFFRGSNGQFHSIPYENAIISYLDGVFSITDPKGVKYIFSKKSFIDRRNISSLMSEVNVTTYFLTAINLPSGKTIGFEYDKMLKHKKQIRNNSLQFSTNSILLQFPSGITTYDNLCADKFKNTHSTTTNYFTDLLLTKITFPSGTVEFNYTNTITGSLGRKDIDGLEGYSFALDNIKVFSHSSLISGFKTNLDYFNNGVSNTPYQNYRLKLKGIKNILDSSEYSFEYNENNLPSLNSYSKDLWGYHNGKNNSFKAIYPHLYTIPQSSDGSDRSVNEVAAESFILKKINYPTKGYSSFEYEGNRIWEEALIPTIEEEYLNNIYGAFHNEDEFNIEEYSSEFYLDYNVSNPSDSITYHIDFGNSCLNSTPIGTPQSINERSNGYGYLQELQNNGTWKILQQYYRDASGKPYFIPKSIKKMINGTLQEVPFHDPTKKKRLKVMLQRNDPTAYCSASISITKQKYFKKQVNQNTIVGGLRIKSISDFDGVTTYQRKTFDYTDPGHSLQRSSARFTSPLKFVKILENRYHKKIMDALNNPNGNGMQNGPPVYIFPDPCFGLEVSDNQAESSSVFGNDVVTYKYVTEKHNGKGKTLYQFEEAGRDLDIYDPNAQWDPYEFVNKNPISITKYNENGAIVETDTMLYRTNYIKNDLSIDRIDHYKDRIASSTNFELLQYCTNRECNILDFYIKASTENYLKSGKLLLDKQINTQYFSNGNSITKINYNYYETDLNKAINLKNTTSIFPSGEITQSAYQYAYEKGNQKLISANMVELALETEVKKNDKIIFKEETKYDDPATLFPTSVLSYDLQNPNQGSTELSYDKYDSKGNIVQYTNRSGVSIVIIWGYNQTQPIAKIENAKLESIGQPFIDSIVNASNLDAAAERNNDETNLHNAFKDFRNNLSGYQITTYSYDPLIGVRSITPPSGIREVYLYDTAGRLKEIREHNNTGKLLKEFNYHYKN